MIYSYFFCDSCGFICNDFCPEFDGWCGCGDRLRWVGDSEHHVEDPLEAFISETKRGDLNV